MDEIWKRDEIESPCVKICLIDPQSGYCMGCGRTGREISNWSNMSPLDRQTLMKNLPMRLKDMKPARRGGRRARNKT